MVDQSQIQNGGSEKFESWLFFSQGGRNQEASGRAPMIVGDALPEWVGLELFIFRVGNRRDGGGLQWIRRVEGRRSRGLVDIALDGW